MSESIANGIFATRRIALEGRAAASGFTIVEGCLYIEDDSKELPVVLHGTTKVGHTRGGLIRYESGWIGMDLFISFEQFPELRDHLDDFFLTFYVDQVEHDSEDSSIITKARVRAVYLIPNPGHPIVKGNLTDV